MVQQEEQVAADVKLVRNLLEQEFLQETTCHEEDVVEGGGTFNEAGFFFFLIVVTIFSNWTPSNPGYQLVSTTHD